jgi:pSer/pThr/pTyr-binding forkhead associated (FHA) protein
VRSKPLSADPLRITLGRSSVCDIVIPFAAVSKVHAYLGHAAPHQWQIEDAGSTNGTAVDGAKVKPHRVVPIQDSSTVEFGKVSAKFLLPVSFWAELRSRAGLK